MRPLLQRYGLELALCAACCCATLLLDGGRARTELLWGDEIVSVRAIQQDFEGLIRHRYWQGHSPLYFLLLKLWVLVTSGVDGLARPGEYLLRLPSLILMGLAGGLLAATAWRAWGVAAGMLLLALWLGNNLVERYAVEARPYAMLLFFLAAAMWSSTRLWLANEDDRSIAMGAVAVGSRILAAATIPVGVIAVLAMEACSFRLKGANAYNRFWRYRSLAVLAAMIIIVAVYAPAIAAKADGYWVETYAPLSWMSLGSVAHRIFLNGATRLDTWPFASLAGAVMAGMAVYGLTLNRHELPARLAAGLAFAGSAALILFSVFNSLMLTRYFISAAPGILLLAVSATTGKTGRGHRMAVLALACSAVVMLAGDRNRLKRPNTFRTHLDLITSLQPGEITGSATDYNLLNSLDFYLPARTGYRVNARYRKQPMSVDDLPEDSKLHWLFSTLGPEAERTMVASVPVLCRYSLQDGAVFVIGSSRAALPASMRDCPPYDGLKKMP